MNRLIGAALAAATVATTMCIETASASASAELTPVTVGAFLSVNGAPLMVADHRGYFEDEGLDVEITPVATTADGVPLLSAGRIDVLYGGAAPAMLNGVSNGIKVKYVASGGLWGDTGDYYFGASFVADAAGDVQSVADLAGQKIAVNGGLAGPSAYWLSQLLTQADLTLEDVEIVPLGIADGLAALENGAVVAAVNTGTTLGVALADGSQIVLGDYSDVLAQGAGSGFMFGESLLDENPDVGVAFLRALLRAVRDDIGTDTAYMDDPGILEILATSMDAPPETFENLRIPIFSAELTMEAQVLLDMQDFWMANSQLSYETPLTADDIVDTALLERALDALDDDPAEPADRTPATTAA